MTPFYFTLLACALIGLAGRDAVRVSRLSARLGHGPGLFAAIILAAIASSVLAAFLGAQLASQLTVRAGSIFLAIALVLAAAETAFRRAPPAPQEPTRSTGAIALVLTASLATDGARFVILGAAAISASPRLAGLGGIFGSGAVLCIAALAQGDWERLGRLAPLRIAVAILLLAAAGAMIVLSYE